MLRDCYVVGLCCTTMQKEPVKPLIYGLVNKIEPRDDFRLLVYHCFEDLYQPDEPDSVGASSIFEAINYDMLDVMVMMQTNEKQEALFDRVCERCIEHGVPVISVDLLRNGVHNINFSYGEAFSDIVEHVIAVHGAKTLIHMAGQRNNSFSRTRIDSFAQILQKHGIEFHEEDVLYGQFWDNPTYEAMDEFFASGKPIPDAFVCANDSMAIAVCSKLAERGYRVPEDVIVTGFDGIEMEKFHNPRLTMAHRDDAALADAIINMIDNIVLNGNKEPYNVDLSYSTVFSESCGCVKCDAAKSNRMLSEYVRNYSYIRGYEEVINRMGHKISSNPSIENARKALKADAFGGTTFCVTEDYMRSISADNDDIDTDKFETDNVHGYSENMYVLCECLDGGESYENILFSTSQILPNLYERFPGNHTLVVSPLHSQELVIGYYVGYFIPYDLCLDQLYTYNMMANRCLEVVRTHEHMCVLNRKLEFMFSHDQLTKIYNRHGFYKNFREDFARITDSEKDVFIVSIDLNDMKEINDTYGHHAGDNALCITANALMGAGEDGDTELICSRFGGDEFVVAKICSGDARDQAKRYREKFDHVLADLNENSGYPYKAAVSIGVYSTSLSDVNTIDELIELADRLMYDDKARHKRCPRNYNPEDKKAAQIM